MERLDFASVMAVLRRNIPDENYGNQTDFIYINYPGDLKQAVVDLDFADDLPDESDDSRFKRHNRFLRSLREDTLLIVDNFNVTHPRINFWI